MSLDPEIKIVEHLRSFVQKYIATGLEFGDVLNKMKAGPFDMGRLKRLALKHGAKALQFFENPTVRIAGHGAGTIGSGSATAGVNIAYGFIIAALIVFAALLGNESDFERWIRSSLHLPNLPILPMISLAAAGCLWLRLVLRNRLKKGTKDELR